MCRIFLVKVLSSLTEHWIWLFIGLFMGLDWTTSGGLFQPMRTDGSVWQQPGSVGLTVHMKRSCCFSPELLQIVSHLISKVKVSEWRIGVKIAWPCVIPTMLVYLDSVVKFSFVLCIGMKMKTGTWVCSHPSVSQEGRTQLTEVALSAGRFFRVRFVGFF